MPVAKFGTQRVKFRLVKIVCHEQEDITGSDVVRVEMSRVDSKGKETKVASPWRKISEDGPAVTFLPSELLSCTIDMSFAIDPPMVSSLPDFYGKEHTFPPPNYLHLKLIEKDLGEDSFLDPDDNLGEAVIRFGDSGLSAPIAIGDVFVRWFTADDAKYEVWLEAEEVFPPDLTGEVAWGANFEETQAKKDANDKNSVNVVSIGSSDYNSMLDAANMQSTLADGRTLMQLVMNLSRSPWGVLSEGINQRRFSGSLFAQFTCVVTNQVSGVGHVRFLPFTGVGAILCSFARKTPLVWLRFVIDLARFGKALSPSGDVVEVRSVLCKQTSLPTARNSNQQLIDAFQCTNVAELGTYLPTTGSVGAWVPGGTLVALLPDPASSVGSGYAQPIAATLMQQREFDFLFDIPNWIGITALASIEIEGSDDEVLEHFFGGSVGGTTLSHGSLKAVMEYMTFRKGMKVPISSWEDLAKRAQNGALLVFDGAVDPTKPDDKFCLSSDTVVPWTLVGPSSNVSGSPNPIIISGISIIAPGSATKSPNAATGSMVVQSKITGGPLPVPAGINIVVQEIDGKQELSAIGPIGHCKFGELAGSLESVVVHEKTATITWQVLGARCRFDIDCSVDFIKGQQLESEPQLYIVELPDEYS
ncbi:MAG: hypothetical protein RIT45_1796 [Pseudomonadota bacterium]